MPETKYEQIAAAAAAALRAIVGDGGVTYWHTPNKVLRVDDFDVAHLVKDHEVILQLAPGEDRPKLRTTGTVQREMELYVLAARRTKVAEEDPYTVTPPTRWQTQNRLAGDVEKKLFSDVTFGGLALFLQLQEVVRNYEVEDALPWALVWMRVTVTYEHAKGTP